jgi:hypothetical protein
MFDAYNYSQSVIADIPEIKDLYSISGLSGLEEMLQHMRNPVTPVMLAEDSSDGYLNLEAGSFANEFNTVYFLSRVEKLNDSALRRAALVESFALGKKFFKRMGIDAVEFDQAAYGFDKSRIDFQRLGPIGNNYYGYSFSFIIRNENG